SVYAVWSRFPRAPFVSSPIDGGAIWLGRATDGVWETPRLIYRPSSGSPVGNVIVVLPDGTLVDVFQVEIAGLFGIDATVEVIRSMDGGDTWSNPITVGSKSPAVVGDPGGAYGVRTGNLPAIAADDITGALHVVWENAAPRNPERDTILMSSSNDG